MTISQQDVQTHKTDTYSTYFSQMTFEQQPHTHTQPFDYCPVSSVSPKQTSMFAEVLLFLFQQSGGIKAEFRDTDILIASPT